MKKVFLLLFCCLNLASFAQTYDATKVNKKALQVFEKALVKLQNDELKEAIPLLKKAIDTDGKFIDAVLSLGSVYAGLKDYKTAVEYFEKGRSMDPEYFRFYNLPYSINLAGLGRFNDALKAIDEFLVLPQLSERSRKSGEFRKRTYEFGVLYANKYPAGDYVFAPANLGG
jgi:tetratricopeptide (TPR) repeat protein